MRIRFEPRDIWIGVFWKKVENYSWLSSPVLMNTLLFYVCIIPCFPIIFSYSWRAELNDENITR